MAERKTTVPYKGKDMEGTVVSVDSSTERFSEVSLEDGTILKTKLSAVEAIRIDGEWDDNGCPVYSLRSQNVVIVYEVPEELKRKVQ